MKIFHQLGHNQKWGLDSYFQNEVGDGFIFCAYNTAYDKFGGDISGYSPEKYMPISMLDLQYYGYKASNGLGSLDTYKFHPCHSSNQKNTLLPDPEVIKEGVNFQIKSGLKTILIPNKYWDKKEGEKLVQIINTLNDYVKRNRKDGIQYYMTVSFSDADIKDDVWVEKILSCLTDMDKVFDGYYILSGSYVEYKKKISIDFDYHTNLLRIFSTLNKQGFKTIYGYANWDSVLFYALTDIDGISIGTYENLRKFDIRRFTEGMGGGPSKGWYFSEKLLNMVRSQDLIPLRRSGALDFIRNQENIFSDIILDENYVWDNGKPDVHKNYLLAISKILKELSSYKNINERASVLLAKVDAARELYKKLHDQKINLLDESADYHLSTWHSFLSSKL